MWTNHAPGGIRVPFLEPVVVWGGVDSAGLCPPRELGSCWDQHCPPCQCSETKSKGQGKGQGHVQELSPVHVNGAQERNIRPLVHGHFHKC